MRQVCSQCACPTTDGFDADCIAANEVTPCVLCGCTRQHLRGLVADDGGEIMRLRAPKSEPTATQKAHIRAPSKSDFNPWLKPADLGKSGKGMLKILAVRDSTSEFSDWICDVKLGAKAFAWGIKEGSGNHRRLWAKFKAAWPGKQVKVEVKTNLGKKYVAVSD